MSFYNIYPQPKIDYLICCTCRTETFAWLTDIFLCVVCGSDNFVHPEFASAQARIVYSEEEIQFQLLEEYEEEIERCDAEINEREERNGEGRKAGKRKQSWSGDDDAGKRGG